QVRRIVAALGEPRRAPIEPRRLAEGDVFELARQAPEWTDDEDPHHHEENRCDDQNDTQAAARRPRRGGNGLGAADYGHLRFGSPGRSDSGERNFSLETSRGG